MSPSTASPSSYKCTVEGVADGVKGTSIFFPDNRLDLAWTGGNRVTVTIGIKPQETAYVTADGITRFTVGQESFYASDRSRTNRELASGR